MVAVSTMLRMRTPLRLAAATAVAVFVLVSSTNAKDKVIPSERCLGLWLVPVTFDGDPEKTLILVLDTGASHTSIDPDSYRRITGRKTRPGKSVRLRNGEAGPLKINKLKADVHDMDHLVRALGAHFDGILGFPTFKDFLLTLDYHTSEVRVGKGSLPPVDGKTIFKDVGKLRPYLALEIGETRLPVLIDSGSTSGLHLRDTDEVPWAIEPRAVAASVRYNRVLLEKTGRLDVDVAYGPLIIEKPVADATENATRIAGEDILNRFALTFDQRTRRIRMIPDSDEPIRSDPLRGIGVAFSPEEEGLEVIHIFPDTPGAESEIRKGDVLVAIDDTPIYERGCSPAISREADYAVLSMLRDGDPLSIEIEVVDLVP